MAAFPPPRCTSPPTASPAASPTTSHTSSPVASHGGTPPPPAIGASGGGAEEDAQLLASLAAPKEETEAWEQQSLPMSEASGGGEEAAEAPPDEEGAVAAACGVASGYARSTSAAEELQMGCQPTLVLQGLVCDDHGPPQTMIVLAGIPAAPRVSLEVHQGSVSVRLWVQPDLWKGRQVGKWTLHEHQQMMVGVAAYGHDWPTVHRMLLPSRSAIEVERYGEKYFPVPSPRSHDIVASPPVSLAQREASVWQVPTRRPQAATAVIQDCERLDTCEGIASAAAALSSISAMPADWSASSRTERKRKAPAVRSKQPAAASASQGKAPGSKRRRSVRQAHEELFMYSQMQDLFQNGDGGLTAAQAHLHAQLSLLQRLDSLKKQEAPPRWDSAPPASSSAAVAEGRRQPRGRWNDSAAPSSRGRPSCEGVGQSGEQPTFLRFKLAYPATEPPPPQPRLCLNPAAHDSIASERKTDLFLECAVSARSSRTSSPSGEDETQQSIGMGEAQLSPPSTSMLATAVGGGECPGEELNNSTLVEVELVEKMEEGEEYTGLLEAMEVPEEEGATSGDHAVCVEAEPMLEQTRDKPHAILTED
ncbi:hypothetical protein AB1Y20_016952 [Prymnesium parvum]|uniref:Uncharacterized protein n=1 Tax=Prymnesium parvum TaxID=97485 RepID=A0AB34ICV1_PRYPA